MKSVLCLVFISVSTLALGCANETEAASSSAVRETVDLGIVYRTQEHKGWCWAAVAQMVYAFRGKSARQCEIVSRTLAGTRRDWDIDCCEVTNPRTINCHTPGDPRKALQTFGSASYESFERPFTEQELQTAVRAGSPVGIFVPGHVILAHGFTRFDDGTVTYAIMDPLFPDQTTFSYETLLHTYPYFDGEMPWVRTVAF